MGIARRQFSAKSLGLVALLVLIDARPLHAQQDSTRAAPPDSIHATRPKKPTQLAGVHVTATSADTTRPLVPIVGSTIGGSIGSAELRALPSDERDPTNLTITAPGAARGVGFFDFAPPVELDGANSLYTPYFIDGLDDNEGYLGGPRVLLPLDAIRQIDVETGTFGVDEGRSANGNIGYMTRGGGDAWHGDVFVFDAPGSPFDPKPVTSATGGGPTGGGGESTPGFRRFQVGGSSGGPLVPGRTYVFGAIDYADERFGQPFTGDPALYTGGGDMLEQTLKAFGRIDQRWSETEMTTVEAAYSGIDEIGQGGGVVLPQADITQRRIGSLVSVRHQSVFGGFTNSAAVQVGTYHYYYPPSASGYDEPQVNIVPSVSNQTVVATVGSSAFQFNEQETQIELRDVLDRTFGAHHLSFGGDVIRGQFHLINDDVSPAGVYTISDSGSNITRHGPDLSISDIPPDAVVVSYTVDANPEHVAGAQVLAGAFLNDVWVVSPSVTLTGGLRWDYDDLTAKAPGGPDLDNLQPRFSLNWHPTERDAFHAGAGIYVGKIPFTTYTDYHQFASTGDLLVTLTGSQAPTFAHPPNLDSLRAAESSLPPREVRELYALGAHDPQSYELSLGYAKKLADRWGVSISGLVVGTRFLPRLWDLNADTYLPPAGDTVMQTLAFGDAHRPVTPENGSYRWLTTTDFGGQSIYWGVLTTIRHQFSDAWSADLNYTLSRARDNTEDINFYASQGNDFHDEWADAANDRRHRVVGRAMYDYHRRLQLSTIVDFETGTPYNVIAPVGSDFSGSGNYLLTGNGFDANYQRWPGTPRNSGRLPSDFNTGISATYALPVGGGHWQIRGDVLNLFNTLLVSGYVNNAFGGGPRTQVALTPAQVASPPLDLSVTGPRRVAQFSTTYTF